MSYFLALRLSIDNALKSPDLREPPSRLSLAHPESLRAPKDVRVEVPAEQTKGAHPKDKKTTLDIIIVWFFNYFACWNRSKSQSSRGFF